MAKITTKKGQEILVDDADYDFLKQFTWYIDTIGYVRAGIKKKTTYMHRLIMQPPKGMVVDHINHNKLDNRRENLRVVTQKENCQNRRSKPKTPKQKKPYDRQAHSENISLGRHRKAILAFMEQN